MPLYEYRCADCHITFDKLRPMSQADAPIVCTACGSATTSRALSLFAAISKSSGGATQRVSGTGGGCGSCGASSCAGCSH
jgi:putative FmdB family regulatory protein